MSELKVSNNEQEYRVNRCGDYTTTPKATDKIEVFADSKVEDFQNLPDGYSIERTSAPETEKIVELEKSIEKDIRQLNALLEEQKNGIKGSFKRTDKQEKTMCWIGGGALTLGTLATWAIDKKGDWGGMLGLFTGFGLLGGMALMAAVGGVTALTMRNINKKRAEGELQQTITQLQATISEKQELLKQLKESA